MQATVSGIEIHKASIHSNNSFQQMHFDNGIHHTNASLVLPLRELYEKNFIFSQK